MTPRRTAGWLLLGVYYAAVVLPHEFVQRWLARVPMAAWSFYGYELRVMTAWYLAAIPLAALVGVAALRRSRAMAAAWTGLVLAAAAVDRWLLFSQSERIHYPQYAILAWGLYHLLDSRVLSLSLAGLLGTLDEAYQAFVLYRSRALPLDVKDVLLDLMGAAMGLVIQAALSRKRGARGE